MHFVYGLIPVICLAISCGQANQTLVAEQQIKVKTTVQHFADSIAADVTKDGPIAWLKYFNDSPDFFMISDGQMVFKDYAAADRFIKTTLMRTVAKIALKWNDTRIDPLAPDMAAIATGFHEDITDNRGKIISYDGYFTAIAQKNVNGWQLRNAHWSIKH